MNILSSGNVTSLTLGIGGSGYTTAPIVTIAAPTNGVQATAVATIAGGSVTGFIVTNSGSGYDTVPTVTISAPSSGVTATATAVISPNDYINQYNTFDQWRVKTNRIVDATLDGQIRGNIIASGRSVTSVQVVNGGSGYTTPTITFGSPSAYAYLDVNVNDNLTGTMVTDLTGTIKQIVISATLDVTNVNSIYIGDTLSQSTTLTAAITSTSSTSISITSGTNFSNGDIIQIDNEKLLIVSGGGTTSLVVTRGYSNTTATTHLNGATVYGSFKGKIIQKNGTSILVSVLKGTFANGSATTSGNVSTTLSSVSTVSSATARIISYNAYLKAIKIDNVVGTFNVTNLASISTSVADGYEFVNLSVVDSPGTTATGTLTVSGGSIVGVTMTSFGSRYDTPPVITISATAGTPAILQPILDPQPNSFLIFDGTKYVDKPLADEILVTHTPTKASARWNRAKRGYFTSITQLY